MQSVKQPPASPLADRNTDWPHGTTLGPWKLLQLAGSGNWSQVYRAAPLDAVSNQPGDYAVKLPHARFAAASQAIGMLMREASVSRSVSHRHLSCVLSAHTDSPPYFLVFPFQHGCTVADWLANRGRMAVGRAMWILRQVSEGLTALHDAGWVHGDVKPANLFVATSGHATLCDLGFARHTTELQRRDKLLLGSPAYLAPEHLSEHLPITPAADVYSLGISAFEMFTGTLPFQEMDEQSLAAAHRSQPPPDPRSRQPFLPPAAVRLMKRMLAKDPVRRPVGSELTSLLVDLEIDTFDLRD